jgi:hypothetical protein
MTIKATFPDGTIMLFGDSYKSWIDQLAEYCRAYKMPRPSVLKCPNKWIGYGGLKWCAENDLQEQLDDEGQGRRATEFAEWKPLNQIETRTLNKYVPILGHNAIGHAPGAHGKATEPKLKS